MELRRITDKVGLIAFALTCFIILVSGSIMFLIAFGGAGLICL